jgi:hypothetical protein
MKFSIHLCQLLTSGHLSSFSLLVFLFKIMKDTLRYNCSGPIDSHELILVIDQRALCTALLQGDNLF